MFGPNDIIDSMPSDVIFLMNSIRRNSIRENHILIMKKNNWLKQTKELLIEGHFKLFISIYSYYLH